MNSIEQTLTQNLLFVYAAVGIVTFFCLRYMAQRFRPSFLATLSLAVAGIPVSILISSAIVLFTALTLEPRSTMSAASGNVMGAASYFLETGGEFALAGVVAIAAFIVTQFRRRAATA
ncbi:MAG: hypothetical protein KYX69_19665 [Sphingomonas sp.]|uniref:hypothetical protein n=1 Tax=Sphingomonas sp. TaxID=28214 RepID=UPI002617E14B|nr:hypothetical protein [Sphingomonas sp.]MDK2769922.1 hypothetical protein [Sphingomonas sp.]